MGVSQIQYKQQYGMDAKKGKILPWAQAPNIYFPLDISHRAMNIELYKMNNLDLNICLNF